jgi:two-component system response regulator VicR
LPSFFVRLLNLADISGLDVCTTLANTSDKYILMVSAHANEADVLKALGLGADDYIAKPFSFSELVARIQSFLRCRERSRSTAEDGSRLKVGNAMLIGARNVRQRALVLLKPSARAA